MPSDIASELVVCNTSDFPNKEGRSAHDGKSKDSKSSEPEKGRRVRSEGKKVCICHC